MNKRIRCSNENCSFLTFFTLCLEMLSWCFNNLLYLICKCKHNEQHLLVVKCYFCKLFHKKIHSDKLIVIFTGISYTRISSIKINVATDTHIVKNTVQCPQNKYQHQSNINDTPAEINTIYNKYCNQQNKVVSCLLSSTRSTVRNHSLSPTHNIY